MNFGTQLLLNSVPYIVRLFPQFRVVDGVPTDAHQLESGPLQIEEYSGALESLWRMIFMPVIIFNVDETGHQEWADSHPENGYRPD
jgi:hypothetical protein